MLLAILLAAAASAQNVPTYLAHDAEVVFDIQAHTVEIADQMLVPPGLDHLRLGAAFEVRDITLADGQGGDRAGDLAALTPAEDEDGPFLRLDLDLLGLAGSGGTLTMRYGGFFFQPVDSVVFSRENVGGEITATISDEGIYLSGQAGWLAWHPETLATHDVRIDTPAGFETVTQGRRTEHTVEAERLLTQWVAPHPSDGLNLIANRFFVHTEPAVEGVTAYTFFLEDDPRLRATYMERTRAYIEMYQEMIGPYPYAKFATVENWFPTGYGMPSYTLLGGQVLRLPFIPYISFGHEICHNWWGNSVFVDIEQGNWCEGITVYCADYHYKELESSAAAKEYRRTTMKHYAAYVDDPAKDFPLVEFRSRHSGATRAVGYGKSMMVFHMIDRLIGREDFLKGLRLVAADHRFEKASWNDFLAAFGQGHPEVDWDRFTEQWLQRTGAPTLVLDDVEFTDKGVSFRLNQGAPPYDLNIPVVLTGSGGSKEHIIHLDKMTDRFKLEGQKITELAIDPDTHLFRRLPPQEIEPTLSQVLADDAPTFILDQPAPEMTAAARSLADALAETQLYGFFTDGRLPADIRPGAWHANVVINPGAELLQKYTVPGLVVSGKTIFLDGKRYSLDKFDLIYAAVNPYDASSTDLVILCSSSNRLESMSRRIVHYGKYSWLLMPTGQGDVLKGNWPPADSPLWAAKK